MTIIRKIRENLQSRPDSEFEQALIRLAISLSLLVYALFAEDSTYNHDLILRLPAIVFVLGLIYIVAVIISNKVSVVRRGIGIIIDIGACSVGIYYGGEWAYSVFWVFIFILIGNGFRYGSAYTYFTSTLSLIGIGVAWYLSPYWTLSNLMTIGLVVGILMITLYLTALLNRVQNLIREVQKATEAKSQFLANISHEIKTPMNGIMGMLDIVQSQELPDKIRTQLNMAKHSAESLLVLMNDILDLSKLESGKVVLEDKTFSIHDLVAEVVELSKASANAKKLHLDYKIHETVPEYVVGDEFRLRQVFFNLLSNAIKFTETGEVKVIIDAKQNINGIDLHCSVIDTGIGIDEASQAKIFDQFEQADASTTRKYGGTGLGLSICRALVEAMNGHISVKSTQLVGSVFEFSVFLKKAVLEETSRTVHTSIQNDHSINEMSNRVNILLVEDNEINQEIARTMFEKMGCNVDVSGGGREVVEYFKNHTKHQVDIIFMDCLMPDMDGYETTESLKLIWENNPDAAIPIIALTANAMPGDKKKCLAAGMDDYIAKPVSYDSLLATLLKWMPERNLEYSRMSSHGNPSNKTADKDKTIMDVLFDANTLIQMREMLGDRYIPMVEEFEKKSNNIITRMQTHERENFEVISALSHDLRGSSSVFGAKKLARLCQTLENQVTIQDSIDKIEKTIHKIKHLNMVTIDQLMKFGKLQQY